MQEQYLPKDKALHNNFLKSTPDQQRSYALDELSRIVKGRAADKWSKDDKQLITLSAMAKSVAESIRTDYQQQIEFCFPTPEPYRLKTYQVQLWITDVAPEYARKNNTEDFVIDYEYSELDGFWLDLAPERMCVLFNWVAALEAWDYCDPEPLSKMIAIHTIPPEFMEIVASIVSGTRRPNKKGAAKLRGVLPSQRMFVAATILALRTIPEAALDSIHADTRSRIAEERGVDLMVIRRELEGKLRKTDRRFAEICGLSVDGVKDLTESLKYKCKNFPKL
ncbi:hypothetical protein [Rheinheimera soli]|uniref:hypothetical protein n=1 Tax=Rheinheimera soli TaxID=443616 RepID=UPI001E440360|nr:hypothetical protein [Rheinheimera soli]